MREYPPVRLCGECRALFTDSTTRSQIFSEPGYEYRRSGQSIKDACVGGCEICDNIYRHSSFFPRDKHVLGIRYAKRDGTIRIVDKGYQSDGQLPSHRWARRVYASSGRLASALSLECIPGIKSPGSAESYCLMKHWVTDCIENHKSCVRQSRGVSPHRLIRLSRPGEPESARLQVTGSQHDEYVALSYCWGGPQVHATRRATYNTYLEELPYAQLPQTILDSFRVTRNLGLSYIWIDSLCIIQDDPEDVTREISMMGQIYQNAFLTISAGRASTCNDGFLGRDFDVLDLYSLPSPIGGPDGSLVIPQNNYKSNLMNPPTQPVTTRAWTLQETMLSQRLLIFTDVQVFWRCQTCFRTDGSVAMDWDSWSVSSGFIWLAPEATHELSRKPTKPWKLDFWKHKSSKVPDRSKAFAQWQSTVHNYTERQLTVEGDKLLAVAAVAEKMSHLTASEYVSGLWKSNLICELLWRCVNSHAPRPKEWRSPSWSWASVNTVIISSINWTIFQATAKVVSCSTTLTSKSVPFGAVTSAELELRGFLKQVEFVKQDTAWTIRDRNLSTKMAKAGSDVGAKFYCDDTLEVNNYDGQAKSISAWCLSLGNEVREVRRTNANQSFQTYCLVLVKSQQSGYYQRIAIFRASRIYGNQANWFEECEYATVKVL